MRDGTKLTVAERYGMRGMGRLLRKIVLDRHIASNDVAATLCRRIHG